MVTDLQFYSAVRSYAYRTRLFESMDILEKTIFGYMHERDREQIEVHGYHVDVFNDIIAITNRPLPNLNQLYIEFDPNPDNGNGLETKCTPPKSERI